MKYIKTFEKSNKHWIPKYKIGDFVRVVNYNDNNISDPYEIISVVNTGLGEIQKLYFLMDTLRQKTKGIYRPEKYLELVPEQEITAYKYNL